MTQQFEHLELPKTVFLRDTKYSLVKQDSDLLLVADNRSGLTYVNGLTIIHEEALIHCGSPHLANTYFSESDIVSHLNEEFHTFLITAE